MGAILELNQILHGDCIKIMRDLRYGSVDMVLADVPYGQTQNDWDCEIPFEPMWKELRRLTKPNAAIVLMAAQPFASKLICSNLDDFRYDLIWSKSNPTGFLNANRQPLRSHEHILVFYRSPPKFTPQKTRGAYPVHNSTQVSHGSNYGKKTKEIKSGGAVDRFPVSVISLPSVNNNTEKWHPTQKPVDLMAWLIRSYTQPGELVLDFAAGSCTTAVAAVQEDRHYICIEKETNYVELARKRLSQPIVRQEQLAI